MRLLVVEDEPVLAAQIADALRAADYAVDVAHDGEEGNYLGEVEPYDAVVLDLGLPKLDGLTVLRRWREAGRHMSVLILTARDRWNEKVEGFDSGADDYAAKPFSMEELLARLRALIRRAADHASAELVCGPLRVDTRSSRELSEAQWAWVIVSERWPAFRRFMLRGGRDRWGHLCKAVTGLGSSPPKGDADPTMAAWLEKDLIFADYLRLYAPAFEREADAVYWLETLQLACGL